MSCERCGAIENLFDTNVPCWHCNYPGIDSRTEEMICYDAQKDLKLYDEINLWEE